MTMLTRAQYLSDIPFLFFIDEFLEFYPDAKIILTSRDEDSWVKSIEDVFVEMLNWKTMAFMRKIDKVRHPDNIPEIS